MKRAPVTLRDLLPRVPHSSMVGRTDVTLTGITCDSREVLPGDMFAALQGYQQDGRRFIPEAIRRGAAAVLCHDRPLEPLPASVPCLICPSDREAFSAASAEIYHVADSEVDLVGVTGTNGKTTVTYLLRNIVRVTEPCGLLGTVEYDDGDGVLEADRTTPEAHTIHKWIRALSDRGIATGIMEVSSHALALHRVRGLKFRAAAFTNLSRDHLDFHPTMEAYFAAKRKLFTQLSEDGLAVINVSDPYGARLAKDLKRSRVVRVVERGRGDICPKNISVDFTGIHGTFRTPEGTLQVDSPLTGWFNLQNLLVASGAAIAMGVPLEAISEGIRTLSGVPGRMQRIDFGQPFSVFVDFAHTDDALKKTLSTVRDLNPSRLITVFGCGGDRDRSKRPLMGAVVARLSDVVVLSTDNPRSEDPAAIAAEVEPGVRAELGAGKEFVTVLDRREAVRHALSIARSGDAVVVAGKGHERGQILKDAVEPYHDPTVISEILEELGWRG
ncbi:MAG: UDP-N-acetylmuramoyl-L-alanyl-D-glutamate--2,6-diaminopimelate ligase [Acidobacteriota bacterium]